MAGVKSTVINIVKQDIGNRNLGKVGYFEISEVIYDIEHALNIKLDREKVCATRNIHQLICAVRNQTRGARVSKRQRE